MPNALGVATTSATIVPMMQRYYDKLFLERLQTFQKYNFLAVPKLLPKNSGKIAYFTRMTQLTANATALTDGVSPSGISTTADSLIATVNPYGAYEWIGRQYELTTLDQGLKEHVELMAQNAGETMDFVLGYALCSSANNTPLCANSVEVVGMDSSSVMTVSGIRLAVKTLKVNKAPKWENGNYRAVINSDGIYQLNLVGWLCRKALKIILLNCRELLEKTRTICSQIRKERFNDYNTAPAFAG